MLHSYITDMLALEEHIANAVDAQLVDSAWNFRSGTWECGARPHVVRGGGACDGLDLRPTAGFAGSRACEVGTGA